MRSRRQISRKRKTGEGIVNSLIDKLPFELHIPGYSYCGPGTKLSKRLARGDPGINPLDEACKQHDIAYSQHKDTSSRHVADKVLEDAAWRRFKEKGVPFGEKMASLGVKGVMKLKRKLGMGLKRVKKRTRKGGALNKQKTQRRRKRILRTPKARGGFLPFLLPLLGALGAVAGGGASIASAVNKAKAERQNLEEQKRHNLAMEQLKGNGLYLKPYKGKGLYLKPYKGYGIKKNSR